VIAETTAELAQKIWEGEVFWKYLDQTIDKQIEALDMFCSELKAGEGRNSLINLEDEDMRWIRDQFLRLKRQIIQNLVEPTHTNLQMVSLGCHLAGVGLLIINVAGSFLLLRLFERHKRQMHMEHR
jgi:hypothetical protein